MAKKFELDDKVLVSRCSFGILWYGQNIAFMITAVLMVSDYLFQFLDDFVDEVD